ncbi:protein-L-isoaspartate(D-aspartate) O-methyltransferase [bacterium]|nr:protein-L-isoaspartate(D-aspartate) O-methyltransferase [bacterium]
MKKHNRFSLYLIFAFLLVCLGSQYLFADDWAVKRQTMIDLHLKARDIANPQVLEAMQKVERHLFVPTAVKSYAYADRPLPIGEGQTISQPYIVALMSQLLQIEKGMKVLEIGTGSGYQAAVLHTLGAQVYSIEIIEPLARRAARLFKEMKLPIEVKHADGYFGWEEAAPFDRIIITAAANHIPRPLIKQLKPEGVLILPLGNIRYYQTLTLATKEKSGKISVVHHGSVRFVPMTGQMLSQ